MKKFLSVLTIAISLAFALAAIPVFAQSGPAAIVNIMSHAFNPTEVTIPTGGRVVWNNIDAATHTVTSDMGGNLTWGSGDLSPNQSYSFTFNNPGTYNYHCNYHSWMTGRVIVQGVALPTTAPSTVAVTTSSTTTAPAPGIPSTGGSAPRDSGSSMTFLFFTAAVGAFGAAAIGLRFWSRGK